MRRLARAVILVALIVGVMAVPVTAADRSETVRTTFEVKGMHCDGCSSTIVGTLERVDGVLSATADHESGVAEAVYRPKKVTAEQLKAAIEKLGYEVTGETTEPVDR